MSEEMGAMRNKIFCAAAAALMLTATAAIADSRKFSGAPAYESEAARQAVMGMIEAHGGLEPWAEVDTLRFQFFTKVIGAPTPQPPFYSIETTSIATGDVILDWPWFGAETVWSGEEVWSRNWPIPPLPPGFFTQLTTSFITLPWLTQTDGVTISGPIKDRLPEDAHDPKLYDVVHMTFDHPNPSIPGEFYDIFIDPDTHLMKAVRFNITHPGMVRIAGQNIGPNFHVFSEYQNIGGLKIPVYYYTYGSGAAPSQDVNALHVVFGLQLDATFDEDRLARPEDAIVDVETTNWWTQ